MEAEMTFENNGVRLYYDKIGDGQKRIIFLHGNGESGKIFANIAKRLGERDFTVYLLDSRGHGQSDKVKRLTYADMASDVLALIKHENLNKPIIYGFSDGGIVALLAAIKDEAAIGKILVSGVNLNPKGIKGGIRFLMRAASLFTRDDKLRLMLTQPNIKVAELQGVTLPVVVFHAERDMVKIEQSKAVAENVKNGQFVFVKGGQHHTYVFDNDKLFDAIKPYIGAEASNGI
jgi:pimeloyl-ACP methyl ester carboxylesterase